MAEIQPKSDQLMPIGKAAVYLNVSIATLRRWDELGMVQVTRPDGKNRFFSLAELERLKFDTPIGIGEAAERLKLSPTTLRRLEARGLITPERDRSGKRCYTHLILEAFLNSEYFLE